MWETLHQYLEKQCDTIAELLPEIGKKDGRKEVHKLRTSIKRARACIVLARHVTDNAFKGSRYVRLLKILHQCVGATRDLDLQQQHLRRYIQQNPQYSRTLYLLLKSQQRAAERQAQSIAAAFPVKFIKALPEQLRKKQLDHAPQSSPKQLSAYLQEQFAAIAAPNGNVSAEQWHSVRKDVKRLYYHLEMMEPEIRADEPLKKMMEFTDKAGSELGAWHDLVAFRQFIGDSTRLMKNMGVTVPKGAAALCRQINVDIRNQLQQCRMLLEQKPAVSLL
ncbi:MAG TPA: CHAD domain-containing protein [Chitinophaga sp.]